MTSFFPLSLISHASSFIQTLDHIMHCRQLGDIHWLMLLLIHNLQEPKQQELARTYKVHKTHDRTYEHEIAFNFAIRAQFLLNDTQVDTSCASKANIAQVGHTHAFDLAFQAQNVLEGMQVDISCAFKINIVWHGALQAQNRILFEKFNLNFYLKAPKLTPRELYKLERATDLAIQACFGPTQAWENI